MQNLKTIQHAKKLLINVASLILILTCTTQARSESANTAAKVKKIQRMGHLDTHSFDDNWLFSRFGLQADGSSIAEPKGIENTQTNDGAWRKIDLPHDWAIEGPFRIELAGETGKLPFKGIGWYRKHFDIPAEDAGKQVFLDFDGAMAYAQIWLNGQYVGTWPYGYSSFRMDLTPFLKFGQKNLLAVRLDTEKWDSRWYPGAGIYRHVWMIKTNPVHVGEWGAYLTTPEISDESATVKLGITVDNQGKNPIEVGISTQIFELDKNNKLGSKVATLTNAKLKIEAGKSATNTTNGKITNPKRWDILNANRYLAQTTISSGGKILDTYYTPFGIRTLEFTAKKGFLLNGRRVEIQGTCNHHDLGALGSAINTSALRRQLSILKEMGCNSLRTSHNPPAPELLELADQMGFLVWDEAFDTWKRGKKKLDYNIIYEEWHERDLKALVHRDRNHPSVFIWSIGNEVIDQRNVEMTKHLAEIVRAEDPTRPVSNGYNDPDGGREVGAAVALDVMGINYFFTQQPKWDADPRYANKPTLGSETSSCVSSRGVYFFGKEPKNWQVNSYDLTKPDWGCSPDDQFRTNAQFPNLLGEYVWTGFDYLGEPTPYNTDETNLLNFRNDPSKKAELEKKMDELRKYKAPSRSSYFGIIDICGFPKDRFYLYQSHWRSDFPMTHILPHWNWPERIDSITPVHVYTSGDEAELFLNGKSLGRKMKKIGQDFRLVWDNVHYQPGELKAVAYKNGKEWAIDKVKTTGAAVKLNLTADRNEITSDGVDLSYITVKIQDSAGLTVPRSHPMIHFEIEGPAEIVATDNGDQTSFVPFKSHDRETFNGMALIIVKAKKGAAGIFKVKAISNGLTSGVIAIQSNLK
jgi:beta-galactosidase